MAYEPMRNKLNDMKYRCNCGQCYGRYNASIELLCNMCGSIVKYRSEKLPDELQVSSFFDLVYGDDDDKFIKSIVDNFKFTLRHIKIIERSKNVMIYYNDTFFLIKNDNPVLNEDGTINVEKTYNEITKLTFKTINKLPFSKTELEEVITENSIIVLY